MSNIKSFNVKETESNNNLLEYLPKIIGCHEPPIISN